MAIQLSTAVRNARLDAIETAIGASAVLRIYSGGPPASCSAAPTGTVLATINLPADYMAAAASGQKSMLGTWADNAADAAGTAGWFGIWDTGITNRHLQGTVTATGGGGDMTVDNTVFAANQQFSITSFTLNEPNA